jgi:hypothetical protein
MNQLKLIIVVVLVAIGTTLAMVQHHTQVRLREENESLQQRLARTTQLEMDNERLSNLVAQADSSLANRQLTELLKLRGEVTLLRRQSNELQTLREQTRQMRSTLDALDNPPDAFATNPPPLAVYPKSSWAFAGYATPEAAFQSLNYAASNGDISALLANSTPEMQAQFASQFENQSESDVADQIKNNVNKNTEVRILKKDVVSDTEVVFTILGDGENSQPENLDFQKIDDQWKLAPGKH